MAAQYHPFSFSTVLSGLNLSSSPNGLASNIFALKLLCGCFNQAILGEEAGKHGIST
jgi:hypothetical protein